MLQEVCDHIHNHFEHTRKDGTFTVTGGAVSPALPLLEGQRFMIVGSVLNDGIYTYHAAAIFDDDDAEPVTLNDETFSGAVIGMAVPASVVNIVKDINDWLEKYGDAVYSPYQSENVIGVYSYTKVGSNAGTKINEVGSWQSKFKTRLNRWRKIA